MIGVAACTYDAFSPQITLETTVPQDHQLAGITAQQVVWKIVAEACNVPELEKLISREQSSSSASMIRFFCCVMINILLWFFESSESSLTKFWSFLGFLRVGLKYKTYLLPVRLFLPW